MWSLAPVALAVLVMLPRLASPQFGLLDDGLTLQTGRQVLGGWVSPLHLIPETGRFFPAYWLAYAVVATFIIVKVVDLILGLRVNSADEEMGLDMAVHGEVAYQT